MTTIEVPAGWYEDPYGTDAQRFHDGTRWTGRTRVLESPEAAAGQPVFPVAPIKPRSRLVRLAWTAPVVVVVLGMFMIVTPLPRSWGWAIAAATFAATVATAGRTVGYRWSSVVLALVLPPVGAVSVVDIAWRLSFWPYRDWDTFADAGDQWVRVTHPSVTGQLWLRREAVPPA